MKRNWMAVLLLLFASGALLGQQSQAPKAHVKGSTPHTIHAKGNGCVRPGKQDGCYVLHDIKQHRYYDLTFDSTPNKPDLFTAISFEGIGYHHDAHCSQGQPVHVHEWKPLPGKCSQPASSKPKAK